MTPEQAMRRVDALLAHVWMVRTFLKHSDDAADDEEIQEVYRDLYDFHQTVSATGQQSDAFESLQIARRKFPKLRAASEQLARVQPEISTGINFQMAVASLATAVADIGSILDSASDAGRSRG